MGSVIRTPDEHDRELLDVLREAGINDATAIYSVTDPATGIRDALVLSSESKTDAELESALVGYTPTLKMGDPYVERIPPAIREASILIREDAYRTDAAIDSAFPAGPMRRMAYGHRAACRAILFLNSRLNDET